MREIKKTSVKEVLVKIVSDDEKFERVVGTCYTEETAKEEVRKYEQSASAILFKRLLDRGVLRKINAWENEYILCREHGEKLSEEQYRERDVEELCNGIVDNYCGNYFFYVFTPKTEEDIKDLLTYGRMDNEDIYFPKEQDGLGLFSCKENELVVGKKYLYCEHNDGYKHMYRLDTMRERLNGWIDYLERF